MCDGVCVCVCVCVCVYRRQVWYYWEVIVHMLKVFCCWVIWTAGVYLLLHINVISVLLLHDDEKVDLFSFFPPLPFAASNVTFQLSAYNI